MRLPKDKDQTDLNLIKAELELEKDVFDKLLTMETYTKIPRSELVCTALKRFISHHKDYFPPER